MDDLTASDYHILRRVLFAGPHLDNRGGISAVLNSYRDNLPEFHMLATNSLRGTVPGLVNFVRTLAGVAVLRARGYRILDVHGTTGKSWRRKSLLIRWAKMLGYKIVFHIHSGEFRKFTEEKGEDSLLPVFQRCDRVVFLTEKWKEYADRVFALGNSSVLNNMVDTPAVRRAPARHEPGAVLQFVYAGWFLREKGVFDLLDVLAEHAGYFRGRARIALCGRVNEDEVKAFIAAHDIADIADFRGWVDGEAKDRMFCGSDVMLLPSYFEGLPICLLEAMTYGMPVVATRVGGIPEIVDDGVNGRLITPGDRDALFEAMRYYIENRGEIARHGDEGRRRSQAFSPERIVGEFMRIISDL